ncbi:ATP-binding cassette domain-containing protein [Marinilabiliaceae bacterium ANBcel2]|nr:ATP-binding cassette domain-containing protein [Marinilabiliaceae bacterium ANBcel2]
MVQEKIIEVNNLTASFGNKEVLKGVSFSAYKKEITVIIGGSGSGKSTILNNLLRLYEPPANCVKIFNRDVTTLTEEELTRFYIKTGVFFQNGALLNSLTTGENIALNLEQHSNLPSAIINDIVKMKLKLVNLEDAFNLYPSQLSGGMLKRAALARAVIMDPPLLFCDEPGAGLDPVSLANLDQLIIDLRNKMNMTIVMITHEVSSIMRIADKIIFLDKGEIIFEGSPNDAVKSNIKAVEDFFGKGRGM